MNIIYPYLPTGRKIEYVPGNNVFMREAESFCKSNSTDTKHPTGAVVVKDGLVIGRAANSSALRNSRLLALHKAGWCLRKWFKIRTGTKYWLCPGCSSFRNHSETCSIKDAIAKGKDPFGADVYLWGHWWCCKPCWDSIIKAGIKNVYLLDGSDKLFSK